MTTLPSMDAIILGKFGPFTLITGILFILLGTAGILLPGIMSLSTVIFSAWLLFLGGVMWGIHTYRYDAKSLMNWFKSAVLVAVAVLMFTDPMSGVEAVGLLLAIYLLLDSFGSFALANSIHPAKGWIWMSFNGATSLLLATLFLFDWPQTSLYLVGLYIGISLLFDGWVLLAMGLALRKK